MVHPLLDVKSINTSPGSYLHSVGSVFAVFDEHTQDSGNVSYGVNLGGKRYFIKTAGSHDDKGPYRQHWQRVTYLLNAVSLAASCDHPALPRLHRVIQSPDGPMLVYTWAPGELIRTTRVEREDPKSTYQRFVHLPAAKIINVLDAIYGLHNHLVRLGWIAMDFYDGCLIYDFDSEQLHIVDLDMYHKGPFINTMGRMFGSSRFMAPEEFILNAHVDVRTTVYTIGRTAAVLLSDGTLSRAPFRGTDKMLEVLARACAEAPEDRYESMTDFYDAWCEVRRSGQIKS